MVDQVHPSTSIQFTIDGHVENFKRSLLDLETRTGSDNFVVTLQEKLESLILTVAKQFSVEETEVNCNLFLCKFNYFGFCCKRTTITLKCV